MDSLNHNTTDDFFEAEDSKSENALKRGREKVKEVAEIDRSDRARVKVKINNIIMVCIVFSHDLPPHQKILHSGI